MPIPNIEKLFDDKVALSKEYSFDGTTGGDRWRVKLRGYWISRCPALMPMLDWAEKQEATPVYVQELYGRTWRRQKLPDEHTDRLNELIWGFLNTCLTGEARTCFDSVSPLNGLDAWRAVVQEIQRGRNIRLAQLRKVIRNPPHISKVDDVASATASFPSGST